MPVLGLWLAIRGRHRALLDAALAMALATFMSNKPYLHGQPNAWDPIVFGVFLMGGAIGVRRWLAAGAGGSRDGFTATRVLASDKATVGLVGMASVAHPGAAPASPASAPPDTIGGGGRSGGAGSSGSF
ncbi:MAG: hypothetical protein A3J29_13415 [Acidobacteria bacterium RIFCSPLOWO2_12_FULL_67_14b]|nr:MAG: hypothetical protein A3J29_13415 [Acidobacteria bacterium RIFCSPLOWO2_12_FULL_67_14b]